MKFSCYKNDLVEALNFAIRASAHKPMTPILSGFYLAASNSQLELQATDNLTGIITRIPVNVEEAGYTAVSAKRLLDFVRNMPDDTITLTQDQNALTIQSGGASVDLLVMNADDFPKVQTPQSSKSFKIKMAALKNLIAKTSFAVAKDDTRPVFTGVLFDINGDKISAVGTNTHRLAFLSDTLPDSHEPFNFLVRADVLNNLAAQFNSKDAEEVVFVEIAPGSVSFSFYNNLLTTRIIEGQFPPFDRVIPKESTTNIKVNAAEFKRVINFVSLMSKETEYNSVKLDVSEHGLEISSSSNEVGDAAQSVECTFDGEPLTINFNSEYLSDFLRTVDCKELKIEFKDRFSTIKITEPDKPNWIYVATPVRT